MVSEDLVQLVGVLGVIAVQRETSQTGDSLVGEMEITVVVSLLAQHHLG